MKNTTSARWWALAVLCMGTLMIVLDTTIVNVALPSIRESLGFSESSLAWVVNAYLLTFGGFLMLGGRLGDLFGHRRVFLAGLALFTIASLICGISNTQLALIAARALQGVGGAVVSAVSLSLIMNLFTDTDARAKAMGYFGFVAAGGGSVGVLLGGVLTGALDWHSIFLVNVPIGIIVFNLSLNLLPLSEKNEETKHLDAAGAITLTLALMLAVYSIVNGNTVGWLSIQTPGLLIIALGLLCAFIWIERKAPAPLIPLELFTLHNLRTANIIGILWAAAMFASFFISALFFQLILGYSPLRVGLAFLPTNIIMAVFSFSLSAKLVVNYGIKRPLAIGLALAACALLLFSRIPVHANFFIDILPGMVLLGIGAGIAFNPMLLAAMNDVAPDESGVASGIVNTAFMMGGALGLAILASLAAARTSMLLSAHTPHPQALAGGYHAAFFVGCISAALAAFLATFVLRHVENTVLENSAAH